MPSLRRIYDRLLRPSRRDRQDKDQDIPVSVAAQKYQNIEANLVHEQLESDQAQKPRPEVPKIEVRKAKIKGDLDEYSQSPSLRSLATTGLWRRDSARSERSRSGSKASSTVPNHWLKDQLYEARIEAPYQPHGFFVPRSVIEELVTVSAVTRDIQAGFPDVDGAEAVRVAENVCGRCRQLYATLACVKKAIDMVLLLEEGITDEDLPFMRKPNNKTKFALLRRNGQPIMAMNPWKDKYLEKFDRIQWWMLAPVFRFNEEIHILDDKTIMPFVPFEPHGNDAAQDQGGYSDVFAVRIHPAHHDFWDSNGNVDDEPLTAVKRLFSADETEFLREATILNAMTLKRHPHLIRLLSTYKHMGKYHLMFPYANANLRKFWDDRPSPEFDANTVLWSLKQMTGIANGLLRIHTYTVSFPLLSAEGGVRMLEEMKLRIQNGEEWYGRHGDIKPENILWFGGDRSGGDPRGVLQIADFGLGRFHGRESRSRVDPESIASSPTYEPPECKLQRPVSRAYDMWGLGCLYLEFITWLLRGSAEIEVFSEFRGREATATGINDDNFFTIHVEADGKHAVVRNEVVLWTRQLHTHEKCSELIHDLLHLVMRELLVTDNRRRCNASFLFQQLHYILMRAEADETYMLTPAPYPVRPDDATFSGQSIKPSFSNASSAKTSQVAPRKTKIPTQDMAPAPESLPGDSVSRDKFATEFGGRNERHNTWPLGIR
ncbi:kinase-like protein [Cadophora sp. DSE1049]|nr:kinase-like protein [Cadophora sp. DSE1049]